MRKVIGLCLLSGLLLGTALPAFAADAPPLSLNDALKYGYAANPTLKSARAALEASESKRQEALSNYFPSLLLDLNGGIAGNRATNKSTNQALKLKGEDTVGLGKSYGSAKESLTLTQTIYDFGRTGGAYDASKASVQSAKMDEAAARETVALAVVQSYFTLLAAQENLDTAHDVEKQMQKHLEQAKARVERGTSTRVDAARAESDLANAQLSVIKAANAVSTARLALNNAMGRFDLGDYSPAAPHAVPSLPGEAVADLVGEASDKRPDILSLRQQIKALEGTKHVAFAGFLPVLAASAAVGYQTYNSDATKSFPTAQEPYWSVGADLSWDLLNGFTAIHTYDAAKANIIATRAKLESLENGIRVDVESAIIGLKQALDSITPSQALLTSAKETLDLAEARYAAGTGTIVDLTDAQATYTQARVSMIQTHYNLYTANATLFKALGRLSTTPMGE